MFPYSNLANFTTIEQAMVTQKLRQGENNHVQQDEGEF